MKKALKSIKYIFPWNVIKELKRYGFTYQIEGIVFAYFLFALISAFTGYLYELSIPYIIAMGLSGIVFVPAIVLSDYKARYEKRRFEETKAYLEQILESFRKGKRFLLALEDISGQFHGPLRKCIDDAIYHILHTTDAKGDVEVEAARMIEADFGSQRMKNIHQFLIKAQNLGGSFNSTIDFLLADLTTWENGITLFQTKRQNSKRQVLISIVLSHALCIGVIRYLPREISIQRNAVVQIGAVVLWIVNLLIYAITCARVSAPWVQEESLGSEKKALDTYYKVKDFHFAKERIKSLFFAAVPLAIAIGSFAFGKASWGFIALLVTGLMVFQHRWDYALSKKILERQVEAAFPSWLMNVSLLLQTENVQVALYKSFEGAPLVLKPELEILYNKLQENPNSVEPYNEFMEGIEVWGVHAAMKMLYSISVGSGGDADAQITDILRRNNIFLEHAREVADRNAMVDMYLLFGAPILTGSAKLLVDMVVFFFTTIISIQSIV